MFRFFNFFRKKHVHNYNRLVDSDISPFKTWSKHGLPIDLEYHDPDEKLDIYECECGEKTYKIKYVPTGDKRYEDNRCR